MEALVSADSSVLDPEREPPSAPCAGDLAAFEVFYVTWFRRIHAWVRRRAADRGDAEDLTQEVFLAVLQSLDSYSGEADFEAWVFGIARNVVRSHARVARRRAARELAPPGDAPPTPEDDLRARRRWEALVDDLREIGSGHAELFASHFVDRVPVRELARRSGRSRHALRSNLYRIRRRLERDGTR
jgi:RNA polymerase sigma-70 factor (ECF subfamily)